MMNLEDREAVKYRGYKIVPRSKRKHFKSKTSGHEWSETISLPGYNIFGIGVFSNQKFNTIKKCEEHIDFLIKFNLNVRI
jgi:hypothetical protein